jgi:hypothetical protein
MKRRIGVLLALCTSMVGVGPVQGQRIDSPYRFIERSQGGGPFGGYVSTRPGTVGFGPESGSLAGVRYAIRLSGPFNIEADLAYFPTTRAVLDTVTVESARRRVGSTDMNLLMLTAALRFNLTGQRTWHRLQPFAVLGAGGVSDLATAGEEEEIVPADIRYDFGTSFAAHFGAGLELYASDRLTLRVDGRNLLWQVKTPEPFLRGELGATTPDREWISNGFISVGLAFRF